jgi:hypothetical protein
MPGNSEKASALHDGYRNMYLQVAHLSRGTVKRCAREPLLPIEMKIGRGKLIESSFLTPISYNICKMSIGISCQPRAHLVVVMIVYRMKLLLEMESGLCCNWHHNRGSRDEHHHHHNRSALYIYIWIISFPSFLSCLELTSLCLFLHINLSSLEISWSTKYQ